MFVKKGKNDEVNAGWFSMAPGWKAKFLWTFLCWGSLSHTVQRATHIKDNTASQTWRIVVKMKLFVCIFAFLQVSHQNPTRRWTLMPHVLVLDVDGTQAQEPLSCLEQPVELLRRDIKNEDILWRRNGVEETQRGNSYLVELEESRGGGNYTCHSKDGSLLNHMEVLLQEDQTDRRKILVKSNGDYVTCFTQNYNGEFYCSWEWDNRRVGKVAFIKARRFSFSGEDAQCSVDGSGQRWTCTSAHGNVTCSVDDSGHGIWCQDQQHCPYAEESRQIHLTVYVRYEDFLVQNYSKYFYLSEIVKPDKVRISKVNTTAIEWTYPSSWSSPYSYFPLTFQIAQLRQCKRCDNPCMDSKVITTATIHSTDICQFQVKHKARAICVRAKDALCNSQWSEWSYIRLRRHKKNHQ